MAEIKVDAKQLRQPSAPDISAVGQVDGALGKAVGAVAGIVGDYVKADRESSEKTIIDAAKKNLERSYVIYKNNPNRSELMLSEFNASLDSSIKGFLKVTPKASTSKVSAQLEGLKKDYETKALNETLKAQEIRDSKEIKDSESIFLASSEGILEQSYIFYKNEKSQDKDSLNSFIAEIDSQVEALMRFAPEGAKRLIRSSLDKKRNEYVNKALDVTLKSELSKSNDAIQNNIVAAVAETNLEEAFILYKNSPNLSQESLIEFVNEIDARIDGFMSTVPEGSEEGVMKKLSALRVNYINKALDETTSKILSSEVKALNLNISDQQNRMSSAIGEGDNKSAQRIKENILELIMDLGKNGVSSDRLINIAEETEVAFLSGQYNYALKGAKNEKERTDVISELMSFPSTKVNEKAQSNSYREYNRLNKLYKEASSIAIPLANSASNMQYKNLSLPEKEANQLYDVTLKNVVAQVDGPETQKEIEGYSALPRMEDVDLVSTDVDKFMVNAAAISIDGKLTRQPSLREQAIAHSRAGAKKASSFPNNVSNALLGGSGLAAKEAVEALTYAYDKNLAAIKMGSDEDLIYSAFKSMESAGRTDYDQMIKEARAPVLSKNIELKNIAAQIFDSEYSTSGKGLKSLNKEFENTMGADALTTGSLTALAEFKATFKSMFVAAEGNKAAALDMTRRQMVRAFRQDKFSETSEDLGQGFFRILSEGVTAGKIPGYSKAFGLNDSDFKVQKFAPSIMLSPFNDTQIQNMFLEQIVSKAESNDSIKLPEVYKGIKSATEEDKMTANLAFGGAFGWSVEHNQVNQAIYITQTIPGLNKVEGRVYFKPSPYMDQNAEGRVAWEVWMQDEMGRAFPVIDNTSPFNNVMTVYGLNSAEFVPEYTANNDKAKYENAIETKLSVEARIISPRISTTPINNYKQRKAYKKDISNNKKAEEDVNRAFGSWGDE